MLSAIILLLILVGAIYLIWLFLYSLLFGAPYAAIGEARLKTMIRLADIKKGEKAADLGSGDGRIVSACAEKGAIAHGYEINPLLYVISLRNLTKKGVSSNAKIFLKDLWSVDFSSYDVVTLYGNFPMMSRLQKKLQKELRPGARVISNHFKFPNWKVEKEEEDLYLYIK
jgi:cyclopropane fatty-acyl-phospholipid synthase-like methyltransferase